MAKKMRYRLRPATTHDAEFLYNLHRETIREAVEATWGPWDGAFQRAYFQDHFKPSETQIVVVDGRDVGVLRLEERPGEIFLALIEIAPAAQGQGLGTQIIRDVVQKAHGRSRPVCLHVLKANPRARQLYERLGFVVVEERDVRFVMRVAPQ